MSYRAVKKEQAHIFGDVRLDILLKSGKIHRQRNRSGAESMETYVETQNPALSGAGARQTGEIEKLW